MWKFVSRRFKDTVERTYNVLDVRQTWTCGVDNKKDTKTSTAASVAINTDTPSTQCTSLYIWRCGDYNKRKSSQNDQYFHNGFYRHSEFIGNAFATTFTLLSGFYLSQTISLLHRKRRRQLDAERNICLFDPLDAQSQDTSKKHYCLLNWAKSVYERSFVPSDKKETGAVINEANLDTFYHAIPVNNDHSKDENVVSVLVHSVK